MMVEREDVHRLTREGFAPADVSVILTGRARSAPTVERLLRTPFKTFDETDTYIDEVAVRRALGGDREVYRHLTPTERLEFTRRADALFDSEREAEWRAPSGRHSMTCTKNNLLALLGVSSQGWRRLKAAVREAEA